ncbi:MAG: HAD family phosphatase [Saprospiraceae bacterium]|nr:HAD family phosphatase [Saprospiraceae bacterium]
MAQSAIRNLIFDLGNVIIDLDFNASETLLQELTEISFVNPAKEDLEVFMDFECGRIPEAIFLNHLIKKSDGKAQAYDLIEAWTAMLANIPLQRLEMLQALKKDYQVYILSNTNETHIRWVDQYLRDHYNINQLSDIVHQAFYSHDLKARKPDDEIYLKMLQIAGISPQESLFFDDHPANIEAAKLLGIHGHVISPKEEIIDVLPKVLADFQ